MGNCAFLCVTNTRTIYPNWSRRFIHDRQLVSTDVYAIPLMWLALFRPEDMARKTLTLEGRKHALQAPLATVKKAIRQLDEAVPYFNRLFRREGPLDEYAAFLREELEGIEYRYITIDLHEIAIMMEYTLKAYYDEFRIALERIAENDLSSASKIQFKRIAGLRKLKKFPPARFILDGLKAVNDNDCEIHTRLLGCGGQSSMYGGRHVPWEP
jgi:hypothetical protein